MVAAPRHPIELPALGVVLVRADGCVALTSDGDQAFELPWRGMPLGFHAYQGETLQPRDGLALPPVQSGATAMIAARHVHQLASWSDRPVVVENAPRTRTPGPGELSEGAFLARVALAANCPIALDLEAVSVVPGEELTSVLALVAQLPRQRVAAIRLAIASLPRWLPVLRQLVPRLPRLKAILLDLGGEAPDPSEETRSVLAALWSSRSTAVEPGAERAAEQRPASCREHTCQEHSCPSAYPDASRFSAQPSRVGRRQRTPLLFLAHG